MGEPRHWSTRSRTHLNPFGQWLTLTVIHFLSLPLSQFSWSADPSNWSVDKPGADDDLHQPDPRRDILNDSDSTSTLRGLTNLCCLALLLLGFVTPLWAFSLFFFFLQYLSSDASDVTFHPVLDPPSSIILSFQNLPLMTDSTMAGPTLPVLYALPSIPILPGGSDHSFRSPNSQAAESYRPRQPGLGNDMDLPPRQHTASARILSDEFNNDGRTLYPSDDPH